MTSQLVIFRAFFFSFFRPRPYFWKKTIPINQLIKKSGLNIPVNSYGHVVMVSSPNHTFS